MKVRERQRNLTAEEKILIRKLYHEKQMSTTVIAGMYDRDKSCISRIIFKQKLSMKKIGRPRVLSEKQVDKIIATKDDLVDKAAGKKEITMAKIVRRARTKASARTVRRRFKARKIKFAPLREKILLTPQDKKDRLAFAKKYMKNPKSWWGKTLHVAIDNKYFKIYHNGKHRDWAARRSVRGAYRSIGQGLDEAYVKPKGELKYNTGMKNACITGGVGRGKVIVWHENTGKRWSGKGAEHMYKKPIAQALKRTYPTYQKKVTKNQEKWQLLEDNDPTGYQSKKGKAAKVDAKIEVFHIPKRSPDLSVLDYAVWDHVNKRMRKTEATWPQHKTETRLQFLARLKRTAKTTKATFLKSAMSDMTRRCKLLYEAKGGHFDEGKKMK